MEDFGGKKRKEVTVCMAKHDAARSGIAGRGLARSGAVGRRKAGLGPARPTKEIFNAQNLHKNRSSNPGGQGRF